MNAAPGPHPRGGARRRPPDALRVRLVRAHADDPRARRWSPEVERVIVGDHPSGAGDTAAGAWRPVRVHGGPGSGKTALIIDAAVARLSAAGADPESVLVLASDRRAAASLRSEITRRVLAADGSGRALREPLVRTVHSYAFAILRLQASAHGNPPPRLITGSEQDVVLRELLAGDIEDGALHWPERLRPALGTDGFAQALRDLIMRSAERGVGPEELARVGRAHRRPEWVAAARPYAQYEQNMLLRGAVGAQTPGASAPAVDAAELVGSALSAFATDPDLLTGQRARIRHLLVDDAQHLDPQAADLIRLLGTGTESTIVAADTDQSIFAFRGADTRFADGLADPGSDADIVLRTNFRNPSQIAAVGRDLVTRLPGARPHAFPMPAEPGAPDPDAPGIEGSAAVRVFTSGAKEATAVADLLRRAHLFDEVPWSQMAVVVRSVPQALPALRRAFRSAGVPVTTPVADLPLHRQRSVAALMSVLRAVAARHGDRQARDDFTVDDTLLLLGGPIGGADPGAMRRLRRGVRRYDDDSSDPDRADSDSLSSLRRALLEPDLGAEYAAALTEREGAALVRVRATVDAASAAHVGGRGLEETLWAAWQAAGLERRWVALAIRGGPAGEQADRDLDAMMALFSAAAGFADNLPAAGPAGFVHHLTQMQIPRDDRNPSAAAESVTVLSAHAAAGREWDVVAVAGVLDGLWPSLRSRGSVLGTPDLVDLLDGIDPDAVAGLARGASALADERRLLLVACTRARRTLLVTAVDDGGGDAAPSRFVAEIASALEGRSDATPGDDRDLPVEPGTDRVLSLPSLVATLRAAVVAGAAQPGGPSRRTIAAVAQLARLADSDIPGAHPRDWFGLAGPSTDAPLWTPARGPIVLSPSNVDQLDRCALRWMFERNGGRDADSTPAITGTVIHTLVQAVAGEIPPEEVTAALRDIWDRVDTGASWYSARELQRAEGMLANFRDWLRVSRAELAVAGVEAVIDATIAGSEEEGIPPVRLRGRVDRLETDAHGRPVIVDVKTAKTPASQNDTDAHAQLAAYQVAIAEGGAAETTGDSGPVEPGGGRLVFVSAAHRTTGASERIQSALTAESRAEWVATIRAAALAGTGPRFAATPNPGCSRCGLIESCPAQPRGKSVTDD